MKEPDDIIKQIAGLAYNLDSLAVAGYNSSEDDGCVALFGMVRDCAYRLMSAAEHELLKHEERMLHDPSKAKG